MKTFFSFYSEFADNECGIGKREEVTAMGLFDNLFQKKKSENKSLPSEKVIQSMLANAEVCLESNMPERAFETYKQIVKMAPNTTAQYNLGSLYAQGRGTDKDFLQAAYWFRQAAANGESSAEKLLVKSTMDYFDQDLSEIIPYGIYQKTQQYILLLYPKEDGKSIAIGTLYSLAGHHFNKKEYEGAAKLFRTAAEYYNHGESQNYLAVLYNLGAGLEKDDIAAMYWFDRAADNGVEAAKKDRDGILNAYFENSSPEEFFDIMEILAKACSNGTIDIPQDYEKAKYWRTQYEKLGRASM